MIALLCFVCRENLLVQVHRLGCELTKVGMDDDAYAAAIGMWNEVGIDDDAVTTAVAMWKEAAKWLK